MIDEKKLIEKIERLENLVCGYSHIVSNVCANLLCELKDFIKEQPKVDEWIPVEERLPEDTEEDYYQTVIVTLLNGRVAPGVYKNHEDEWVVEDETGANEYMFHDEVIAWMPLPEPYVKED